jgi:hypothetical protein
MHAKNQIIYTDNYYLPAFRKSGEIVLSFAVSPSVRPKVTCRQSVGPSESDISS